MLKIGFILIALGASVLLLFGCSYVIEVIYLLVSKKSDVVSTFVLILFIILFFLTGGLGMLSVVLQQRLFILSALIAMGVGTFGLAIFVPSYHRFFSETVLIAAYGFLVVGGVLTLIGGFSPKEL